MTGSPINISDRFTLFGAAVLLWTASAWPAVAVNLPETAPIPEMNAESAAPKQPGNGRQASLEPKVSESKAAPTSQMPDYVPIPDEKPDAGASGGETSDQGRRAAIPARQEIG